MKRYDPDKPLISVHVPKCAGMSFRVVLEKWFGGRLYLHYFNEAENRMPERRDLRVAGPGSEFKRGVCIHGHFNAARGFGAMDYYPEVDQFITILREPVEMALSNYFFRKKLGAACHRDGVSRPIAEEYGCVEEFLRRSPVSLLSRMPFELTFDNYEEMLERRFVYVGITEDLQASVAALAGRLGFQATDVPVRNTSEHNEDVPASLKEEYRESHALEYAIYEHALRRYKDL
ncbi:MAG: hypothetical protein HY894_02805 [Deltaproteobacteria bacterium]|nr:hypothetical protein [Deltaproteobacteria bacterium]